MTNDDTIVTDRDRKVFKFGDGRLFAYSGAIGPGEKLKSLTIQHEDPIPDLDCEAILVMPDGSAFTYQDVWVREAPGAFRAIGSGAPFAYGAMEAGATAEEAVRMACKRHTHSGGLVRVVRLDMIKVKK